MRILLLSLALIGTIAGQAVPPDASAGPDQPIQTSEQLKQQVPASEETVAPIAADEFRPEEATQAIPPQPIVVTPPTNPVVISDPTTATKASQPDPSGSITVKDIVSVIPAILIGLIPAWVASKKGRSFRAWWLYGIFLLPIALVHMFMLKTQVQLQAEAELRANAAAAGEARRQAAIQRLAQMGSGDTSGYFREKLRQYARHSQCNCMECGYGGFMGIVDQKKPLHENGLLKFAALMNTGPARTWYAASATMGGVAKNILECPNCGNQLEQETGTRPAMIVVGR